MRFRSPACGARWAIEGHFGGRDHSTVLHAYRNIDKLCDHDENTRLTVESLVTSLTQK